MAITSPCRSKTPNVSPCLSTRRGNPLRSVSVTIAKCSSRLTSSAMVRCHQLRAPDDQLSIDGDVLGSHSTSAEPPFECLAASAAVDGMDAPDRSDGVLDGVDDQPGH